MAGNKNKQIKKILIIEDDPLHRELEKSLFEEAGYIISEAENAQQGTSAAIKNTPDLIILDYQLPGMTGIQVVDALKDNLITRNIPCVIVTATATEDEVEKFKSAKICGYITKPIDTRTFVKRLIKLVKDGKQS
ncbi:MAG: response regulator [Dehalococcoidia bacterium]|jgi:CheY-like chemotaxis protein